MKMYPILLLVGALAGPAMAETAAHQTDDVCPPADKVMKTAIEGMSRAMLRPGEKIDFATFAKSPEAAEARRKEEEQRRDDWANLCFYAADNSRIENGRSAVFMGDLITFNWEKSPDAFDAGWVGRGISGQTTSQMLVRFQADVIALHPKVVHIMGGTNDIAGNTGPTTDRDIENNIEAMTTLAKANGIKVILAAVPLAAAFPWSSGPPPVARIRRLNQWIKAYAQRADVTFADYYAVLATKDGSFSPGLSNDGVHPNNYGYALMKPLADGAVRDATSRR